MFISLGEENNENGIDFIEVWLKQTVFHWP